MRTILALLLLTACTDHDPDAYTLARSGAKVAPGPLYRSCETSADCVLVNVTCDGCCDVAAIAEPLRERFMSEKDDACAGYHGGICDCAMPALGAVCVANVCTEAPTR
jgi:hypothetical protein